MQMAKIKSEHGEFLLFVHLLSRYCAQAETSRVHRKRVPLSMMTAGLDTWTRDKESVASGN